jgi:hypothetical protein
MFKGLCCTCIHAADCVTAMQAGVPVVHCEEFDDRVVSARDAADSPFALRSPASGGDKRNVSSGPELKGLCLNCDSRKVCKHPKPLSGIWYCEEYR